MAARYAFERPSPRYAPQPRVLIICEDSKSSLTYLSEAARHFRASATEIVHCGKTDPVGIVNEAKRRRKKFDSVHCVVDADAHPGLNEAHSLAADAGIELLVSYPCYEYWLLLHFIYSRAPVARQGNKSPGDCMVGLLEEHLEGYAKGGSKGLFRKLLSKLPIAEERARMGIIEAESDGELNPSTPMHNLIDLLRQQGSPKPVGY